MEKRLTILLAEDDKNHRSMLTTMLREWGYAVLEAKNGEEAVKAAVTQNPDLALLDVRMPRKSGIEALAEIKAVCHALPVIIMTAYSEIPAAVDAIRKGAYDYLTKPLNLDQLKTALANAFAHLAPAHGKEPLEELPREKEMLGQSPVMRELDELLRTIAPTEATVLISGESGTGKELAARAVHALSRRSQGPFVAINCGALTSTLLTSELFGHEKGAFTGADRKRPGLFLEAAGGSIFLDEIGELPLDMQVKLLRVLQEKEVLSVGGQSPQPVDCRVIAATNKDLFEEVQKGAFREDLYYRLNVVTLNMPPLRDRGDDIRLLAENFARRFSIKNRKPFAGISAGAMRLLRSYAWPGNIRELENVMERAIILMPGEYIGERELPQRVCACAPVPAPMDLAQPGQDAMPTLEEVEKNVILRTLEKMGNNKTEAAKVLGITRKTLHAKLNKYRVNDNE